MDAPTTSYVSRVVELPAPAAALALDARIVNDDGPSPVATVANRLRVHSSPQPLLGGAWRRFGRLDVGGIRRSIPVELEVTRWSRARCEIGLRPRRPMRTSDRRYFTAAAEALDQLGHDLASRCGRAFTAQSAAPVGNAS